MRAPQKRRSKDSAACDGKAWTHAELRALEDGLVALGAGRAAELRAQVLASAWPVILLVESRAWRTHCSADLFSWSSVRVACRAP